MEIQLRLREFISSDRGKIAQLRYFSDLGLWKIIRPLENSSDPGKKLEFSEQTEAQTAGKYLEMRETNSDRKKIIQIIKYNSSDRGKHCSLAQISRALRK